MISSVAAAIGVSVSFAGGCGDPEPDPATSQPAEPAVSDAPAVATNTALPDVTNLPGQTHIVQPGDTLVGLAERYYGNRSAYRRIFVANRNRLSNPDDLPVGMKLIIP